MEWRIPGNIAIGRERHRKKALRLRPHAGLLDEAPGNSLALKVRVDVDLDKMGLAVRRLDHGETNNRIGDLRDEGLARRQGALAPGDVSYPSRGAIPIAGVRPEELCGPPVNLAHRDNISFSRFSDGDVERPARGRGPSVEGGCIIRQAQSLSAAASGMRLP